MWVDFVHGQPGMQAFEAAMLRLNGQKFLDVSYLFSFLIPKSTDIRHFVVVIYSSYKVVPWSIRGSGNEDSSIRSWNCQLRK
jgi:hypothetical protein